METVAFYIFAAIAVLASIGVIGQRNPMYSVMLLITSFGALAGLYVLLDAPFTAVTQIIIYAGAIMVLFLFVVMLLNVPREEPMPSAIAGFVGPTGLKIGAVLSVALAIEVVWALSRIGTTTFPDDVAERSFWKRMNDTSRVGYASLCAQMAENATSARSGPTPPCHA